MGGHMTETVSTQWKTHDLADFTLLVLVLPYVDSWNQIFHVSCIYFDLDYIARRIYHALYMGQFETGKLLCCCANSTSINTMTINANKQIRTLTICVDSMAFI